MFHISDVRFLILHAKFQMHFRLKKSSGICTGSTWQPIMPDASSLLAGLSSCLQYYNQTLKPLCDSAYHHAQLLVAGLEPNARLGLLGAILLCSLLFFYRTARFITRAVFYVLSVLFQLAILGFLASALFMNKETLVGKARQLVDAFKL